jgi:hypothetical protein
MDNYKDYTYTVVINARSQDEADLVMRGVRKWGIVDVTERTDRIAEFERMHGPGSWAEREAARAQDRADLAELRAVVEANAARNAHKCDVGDDNCSKCGAPAWWEQS